MIILVRWFWAALMLVMTHGAHYLSIFRASGIDGVAADLQAKLAVAQKQRSDHAAAADKALRQAAPDTLRGLIRLLAEKASPTAFLLGLAGRAAKVAFHRAVLDPRPWVVLVVPTIALVITGAAAAAVQQFPELRTGLPYVALMITVIMTHTIAVAVFASQFAVGVVRGYIVPKLLPPAKR